MGGVSLDSSQFRSLARSESFNWAFRSSSTEYWGSQLVSVSSCPRNSGDKMSLGFNDVARLADRIDRGISHQHRTQNGTIGYGLWCRRHNLHRGVRRGTHLLHSSYRVLYHQGFGTSHLHFHVFCQGDVG